MKKLDTPLLEFPPGEDVISLISEWTRQQPDAPALIANDEILTWREMTSRIGQISNLLGDLGIKKGDSVAILARNSIDYSNLFVGFLCAGAVVVPLGTMITSETLNSMLNDSQAKVFFISREFEHLAAPIIGGLDHLLPGGTVGIDFETERWGGLNRLVDGLDDALPDVKLEGADIFNIIYSSGTTGIPKGIVHNHAIRRFLYTKMRGFELNQRAINVVSTPMYSNTTIVTWLPTLCCGGTNVIMRKFDAQEFLHQVDTKRATHAMLVPVQYDRIFRVENFDRYDLTSLKYVFSTSAPLQEQTKRKVLDRFPCKLVEFYGLTEGSVTCMLAARENPEKLASVGTPAEETELKVIDDAGNELPTGQTGELVGRGPQMCCGYHNREEATDAMLWHDAHGTLFFKSGDLGYLDKDGFVHLSDRKKDIIISGGLNIFATDLETVLLSHDQVREAAVIAVPCEQWGETPLALVVLEDRSQLTETMLRDWTNERLGKSQRIGQVIFQDQLPKSPIGKILKRKLKEDHREITLP